MTDTAIKVENLSKRYRIGLEEEVPDTMAGALLNFLKQPGRILCRLTQPTSARMALCYNLHKSFGGI